MSSIFLLHVSYLPLLQALFITATTASPTDIWHVSIWEAPAPPPGKGPPLDDHSLRDLSYLPAQIASIIGAYVLSVLIIGSAILFVGRRLRRATQASPGTLSMEMMKPVKHDVSKAFDPSPVSPSNNNLYGPSPNSTIDMKNNWPSPQNKNARNSDGWGSIAKGHRKQPSVVSSVVTFDESVIEDDKERNQKEMERLYAAVMEHDETKSTSVSHLPDEQRPQSPPELQHLRSTQQPLEPPPRSDTVSPARIATKSPRASSRPKPLSFHSRNSSRSSLGSFSKKRGIRSLPISPPMGSPDLAPGYNAGYGEAEPLTPRVYDDPGPPPLTPPQRKASQPRDNVMDASRLSPRNAQFQEHSIPSIRTPRTSIPAVPAIETIPETYHRPEMQSRNSNRSKAKRTPAPLALRTQALVGSGPGSSSSAQHHPLRSAPLPLRNQHPTNYNSDRPPSMIKATVLERKAPNVQSLRTPMTGVPMTPYSPYMPRTPLTPMTPSRLVTRAERKRREKEEGRRVATIDDAVEEEADMWGDAYP
ncbi:hypothetical protein HO133_002297 [Letharia lupina]|uniref:Uncharacterized protein n=1 Tax=Letharia lupina TaxID=560253 RepID=A0A8H6CDZ7_9LECA|nr:uncharacterized protein HO133_002297 [Letharia lupina]KAF6221441.1 hypothetical protein HO133_002297 [Letharia lupina]